MGSWKRRSFLAWGRGSRLAAGTRPQRWCAADFDDGRKRLTAKAWEWLLEAGQGKKICASLDPPEGNRSGTTRD